MMNFWTIEALKPDADIAVLVMTDADERTMAYWDGEAWLYHESEMPLSGSVTHWCTLEELPTSADIINENRRQDLRAGQLEQDASNLRSAYDNKCDDCHLLKYAGEERCSECCELTARAALVQWPDLRQLCPTCSAAKLQEVPRG